MCITIYVYAGECSAFVDRVLSSRRINSNNNNNDNRKWK